MKLQICALINQIDDVEILIRILKFVQRLFLRTK